MHWRLRISSNAFGWEVKCWILQRAVELWTGCGTSQVKGGTGWHWPQSPQWLVLVPIKLEPEGLKRIEMDRTWIWSDLDFGDWPPQTNDFSEETLGQTMPNTRLWKTGTYWYLRILRYSEAWSILIIWPRGPSPLNQWTYMDQPVDLRMFCCKVLWISKSTNPPDLADLTDLTDLTFSSFLKDWSFFLLFSPLFFLFSPLFFLFSPLFFLFSPLFFLFSPLFFLSFFSFYPFAQDPKHRLTLGSESRLGRGFFEHSHDGNASWCTWINCNCSEIANKTSHIIKSSHHHVQSTE